MSLGRWSRWGVRSALVLGPAVMLALMLLVSPAVAHPLDTYVQATYLTLAPSEIAVEIDLLPGVLIAPRVLAVMDGDGDHQISGAEARTYLGKVLRDADLRVDDRSLSLNLTKIEVPPYLTIQSGYGRLWGFAQAPATTTAAGPHRVFFRNGFADAKAAYQVNTFVADSAPIVLGTQQRDPTQQQTTVSYRVDTTAVAVGNLAAGREQSQAQAGTGRLAGYLEDPSLSVWVTLLALGAAALLGALHALTPGHAKTLMAAYLVGSGGTARNAITLGAVVTFTHTASVVLIGLVALLADQFLVPAVLVPILEGVTGLLVFGLGLRLLHQRRPRRNQLVAATSRELVLSGVSDNHHQARHEHDHHHSEHAHQHGGRTHTHALPAKGITMRSLIALGVSGGLVPCPEALGVMVLAVGVNRTILGLGLILSFSIGLAAVLIGFGLVLVHSRTLLARVNRLPPAWTALLPLVSAAVVTVLGAGLILKALGADVMPL